VAVITFLIGVIAYVPSIEGIGPLEIVDDQTFTCPLLDDVIECSPYDGTQFRIKAKFEPMQEAHLGTIGGKGWLRVVCDDDATSCAKLFVTTTPGFDDYNDIMDVEVIGRYFDHAVDPHPRQRGVMVRLFRITKVINAESSLDECINDRNRGCGSGNGGR
jgi:hypothetical protein